MVIATKNRKPTRTANMVGMVRRFCALTSGHVVHECIKEPKDLSYPIGKRSKRLMHDSQISVW